MFSRMPDRKTIQSIILRLTRAEMESKAVLLVICHWLLLHNSTEGLKLAAYNVRIFGPNKLNNEVAMNMITQV